MFSFFFRHPLRCRLWRCLLASSPLWLVFACAVSSSVLAANADASHDDTVSINPRLSLHDVLQQVVALHPQQALLAAHQQMVEARRTMANSFLPQAPALGFSHQSDALLSHRDEREWQAQMQIPIWLPGQRQARSQVASLADDSLGMDRAGLQQLASELLRNAVWEVALRRNDVALAEQRRDTLRSINEDVKKRFRAGEVARLEVMQAEPCTEVQC